MAIKYNLGSEITLDQLEKIQRRHCGLDRVQWCL